MVDKCLVFDKTHKTELKDISGKVMINYCDEMERIARNDKVLCGNTYEIYEVDKEKKRKRLRKVV